VIRSAKRLATELHKGHFAPGTIRIDFTDGEFTFDRATEPEAVGTV
jgi:hypothetical protein